MKRTLITLAAMVTLYWVWALFGEAEQPSSMPAEVAPSAKPAAAPAAQVPRPDVVRDMDPKIIDVVLTLAKAERLCAKGVRTACRQLSTNENAGARQLAAMRRTLGKGCGEHQARACFLRGDLDLQGGRPLEAAKWFAKSKVLLARTAARCKDQRETNRDLCAQASQGLAELGARERQLEAERR